MKHRSAFIVAAPRSGTTWLQRMLNAHPEVVCIESRPFGNYADAWMEHHGRNPVRGNRITLDAYVRATKHALWDEAGVKCSERETVDGLLTSLHALAAERSGKRVVVDKLTPYQQTGRIVRDALQARDDKVIFLERDGRDVATSGAYDWINRSSPDVPWSWRRIWRRFCLRRLRLYRGCFFASAELRLWADYWTTAHYVAADRWQHHLTYEQLQQSLRETLVRLLDLLEVRRSEEIVDCCVAAGDFRRATGRAPGTVSMDKTRKGVVGDWSAHFTRHDGARFEQLTGGLLTARGYAPPEWFRPLPRTITVRL